MVRVFKHGWFPRNSLYYFIDMEYCSETLEAWIARLAKFINESSLSIGALEGKLGKVPEERQSRLGANDFGQEQPSLHIKATLVFTWEHVIEILENIVIGLVFIHERSTAHRDLKPQNGWSVSISLY